MYIIHANCPTTNYVGASPSSIQQGNYPEQHFVIVA